MFNNRIRHIRTRRGWTQKQVAEKLDISEVRYNQYETGKRKPDIDMLKDIAIVLNTPTDILLDVNLNNEDINKLLDKFDDEKTIENYLKQKGLDNKEINLVQNVIDNLLKED